MPVAFIPSRIMVSAIRRAVLTRKRLGFMTLSRATPSFVFL